MYNEVIFVLIRFQECPSLSFYCLLHTWRLLAASLAHSGYGERRLLHARGSNPIHSVISVCKSRTFLNMFAVNGAPNGGNSTAAGFSKLYVWLTGITSVSSILGCLFLVVLYCVCKHLHTYGRQLLLYLSIADLLTAMGNFLGVLWYANSSRWIVLGASYCKLQSALTIYSSNVSFSWTLVIGIYLNRTIMTTRGRCVRHAKVCVHLLCWGFPGRQRYSTTDQEVRLLCGKIGSFVLQF